MRVNIYAEEITDKVEIVQKGEFTGVRFYLELPVTAVDPTHGEIQQIAGPFMHHPDDNDSAAVTFWGKGSLKTLLLKAIKVLEDHYAQTRS